MKQDNGRNQPFPMAIGWKLEAGSWKLEADNYSPPCACV
jgi:hypothetical protein